MHVTVKGGTKSRRDAIENAALWAADRLMTKRQHRNVSVDISLTKLDTALGFCEWDDSNIRPREFIIKLGNSLAQDVALEVLMHEMIHVRQWVNETMKERTKKGRCVTLWCDKEYDETVPYYEQPWEMEAYAMQGILLNEYVR